MNKYNASNDAARARLGFDTFATGPGFVDLGKVVQACPCHQPRCLQLRPISGSSFMSRINITPGPVDPRTTVRSGSPQSATGTTPVQFGANTPPPKTRENAKAEKPKRSMGDYGQALWTAFKRNGLSPQALKGDTIWAGLFFVLAVIPFHIFSPFVVPLTYAINIPARTLMTFSHYLPGNELGPPVETKPANKRKR